MTRELTKELATDIVDALRDGTVPAEGLEHIAVGLEEYMKAIKGELQQVATRRGGFKAIRGEWGSGKTFLSRLALAEAADMEFATAHVTLSRDETRLYKPEEVYRSIARGLTLPGVRRGALGQLLERWIARHARAVRETDGIREDDPEHEKAVARRIQRALEPVGAEAASFAMALSAYYGAKRAEDFATARGLLGVIAGEPGIGASVKKAAGIKGDLERPQAFSYLRALLEVIHGTGLAGLVVVLDEGDRLTELRGPERKQAYEVLRKLLDDVRANVFPGLYVILTGTRNLFEGKKGIREYGALEQRLAVPFSDDEPDDLKQRQVRLRGFDQARLTAVARRVREIYQADNPARVAAKATDALIEAMVAKVSKGFGDQSSVVPRVFLREWFRVLGLIDQNATYDPNVKYQFEMARLTDLSNDEKVAAGLAAAVEDDLPPQVF